MICENCQIEHDGNYGSGRFCSNRCARGFSTKLKRKEINEKVSQKLSGVSLGKRKHASYVFTRESIQKGVETKKRNKEIKKKSLPIDQLPKKLRKEVIIEEQNGKCLHCGVEEFWNGKPLSFQLDHIDGDNTNNSRANLRILCPNCHSQTETYCGRNVKKKALERV